MILLVLVFVIIFAFLYIKYKKVCNEYELLTKTLSDCITEKNQVSKCLDETQQDLKFINDHKIIVTDYAPARNEGETESIYLQRSWMKLSNEGRQYMIFDEDGNVSLEIFDTYVDEDCPEADTVSFEKNIEIDPEDDAHVDA